MAVIGVRSSASVRHRALLLLAMCTASTIISFGLPSIEAAAANTPSAIELPLTVDDGPVPNAVASAVTCTASTNCVAVGSYQDQIGITHAMTLQLTGSSWTAAQELAPTGPPDYTFADLNSVSCVSTGNCIAVGDYRISTVQTEGFYAVESSGTWLRGQELPLPSDAGTNPAETTFVSASCSSTGTCQLLGEYLTNSPLGVIHSVVDKYVFGTGLSASSQEISQVAGEEGIGLSSISCSTATDCVAVGAQANTQSETAVYVKETGGNWGSPATLENPQDGSIAVEYLSSISCVAVGDCVAAGDWLSPSGSAVGETYTEQAGIWSNPISLTQPKNLSNPFIDDVSCVASVQDCTVVGALTDDQGSLHASTAQMTNGQWGQLAQAQVPVGAVTDHELLGVSCGSAPSCTAVGYYNLPGATGGTEGMAATWTPTSPPGAVSGLHASAAGAHAARLSWTAASNQGSGFSHYEIMATTHGQTTDEGAFAGTTAMIGGLQPGGTYIFSVLTVATDGQTASSPGAHLTLPATLPSSPTVRRVIGISKGLRVLWSPPRTNGGANITSYRVRVACGGVVKTDRFGGSATSGVVRGLPGGTACSVRVGASNHVGAGPLSAAASGHTAA